ncbi:MAG: hypothetical protein ACK4GO_09640 [Gemmobacter sp.]
MSSGVSASQARRTVSALMAERMNRACITASSELCETVVARCGRIDRNPSFDSR